MSTQSILLENPKGDNQSWEDWGTQLAEKYKTPADTPGLPLVPGTTSFRKFLSEFGGQAFPVTVTNCPSCEQLRPGPSTATSGRTGTMASVRHPPSKLQNRQMASPSSTFLLTLPPAPPEMLGPLGAPPSVRHMPNTARLLERSTTQISSLLKLPPTVTGPSTVTSGLSTEGNSLRRPNKPTLNYKYPCNSPVIVRLVFLPGARDHRPSVRCNGFLTL